MKCFAESYCKRDRSECSELCGGYRVLRALYTLSRIPVRYQYNIALKPEPADVKAFEALNDFKENIVRNVEEGNGLYIWGKSTGSGNPDPDFEQVLDMLKKCKLLIIDDIGAERVTEWVRERLVSIINTRVGAGLSTIYTSNLSPEELKEGLGDRISSRVLGSSGVVEITGADRRGW